jgi:SAM-dependent methyltransferase
MSADWAFDRPLYQELNAPREDALRNVLTDLREKLQLKTAIDVGCGLGHFTKFLHSLGFEAEGVDAREENVAEARKRYPDLQFRTANVETMEPGSFGKFDLVLCLGLLYHLENPFRAIRNLEAMTQKLALIEGICYPSTEPVMVLLDENEIGDQGVNYFAFYPSENCLLKMLYRSGYAACFYPKPMPSHAAYVRNRNGFSYRTMILAARIALDSTLLTRVAEPQTDLTPWNRKPLRALGLRMDRLNGALMKVLKGK